MILPKWVEAKPVPRVENYLKFGFVIMEHEYDDCPRCKNVLNAGPNYQPSYCSHCGQKIRFNGIGWKEDKQIGYVERSEVCESF